MNERTIRYHIERINENTGETQYVVWNTFQGIHRTTNEMSSSDGLDDARTANTIATRLNQIDDEMNGKHYYYRVDSDNQTRRIIRDDAPDVVKQWFADEETEEDAEEEENDEESE